MKNPRLLTLLAATAMLAIAGCGRRRWRRRRRRRQKVAQAKASGDVTWCIGKDTTGAFKTVVDNFNKENPDANVELLELPESADEQRRLQIQRLRAESTECDVLGMDVIWTAEYAAQNWLLDISDFIPRRRQVHPVDRGHHSTRTRTGPSRSTRTPGFIYYRSDEVDAAARELGGRCTKRPRGQRRRLPGLPLRGPDRELPRARLQRGRQRAVRGRQGGDRRLAGGQGRPHVHGGRHQERRRSEGRDHLQGGGVAARVRVRQRHLHAQLAVRLRARQGLEDRGQVRDPNVPVLRRQRGRRRARRLQPRDLRLLEEPGGLARVHRVRHRRPGSRRSWRPRRRCRRR